MIFATNRDGMLTVSFSVEEVSNFGRSDNVHRVPWSSEAGAECFDLSLNVRYEDSSVKPTANLTTRT